MSGFHHLSLACFRCGPVALMLAILLPGLGCQRSSAPPCATAVGSASPRELLRQMVETYRGAKSYEDVGELYILPESGQQDEPKPFAVALERPNKIRVHSLGAMLVADGQNLRAVAPSLDEQVFVRPCGERLTPADLAADEMLSQAMRGQLDAGMPQLTLLLDDEALDTLTSGRTLEQLPDAEHQGESCHRVAVKGPEGTAVYWISPTSHLLRKFEFPMNAMREKFPLAAVWIDFKGARIDRTISSLAFRMELPSSARLVKQFIMPPPDAPSPLLAQVAGDFTFVDLQGAPVSRESLAGKVVVLDLWATWCGWCFEGLPLLESVYQKYKGHDRVVFLAVSKDETVVSNEQVRAAFEKHKLTIPIVRDLRQVSDTVFQVQALPTSVLLGTDGSVQDYHVGYDAQMGETLPQKIEKLLAGENLAQQELDAYQQERVQYEKRLSEVLVEAPAPDDEPGEVARKPAATQ